MLLATPTFEKKLVWWKRNDHVWKESEREKSILICTRVGLAQMETGVKVIKCGWVGVYGVLWKDFFQREYSAGTIGTYPPTGGCVKKKNEGKSGREKERESALYALAPCTGEQTPHRLILLSLLFIVTRFKSTTAQTTPLLLTTPSLLSPYAAFSRARASIF